MIDARYNGIGVGLPQAMIFGAAVFLTYQLLRLMQYIPDVLQKQPTRLRVDQVLDHLSEEDLATLRQHLLDTDADYDYDSFDALLQEVAPKRKAR